MKTTDKLVLSDHVKDGVQTIELKMVKADQPAPKIFARIQCDEKTYFWPFGKSSNCWLEAKAGAIKFFESQGYRVCKAMKNF